MSMLLLNSGEFYTLNNFKEKYILINKGEADLFIAKIDKNNIVIERKYLITISSSNPEPIIINEYDNSLINNLEQYNYSYVLVPCGEVTVSLIDNIEKIEKIGNTKNINKENLSSEQDNINKDIDNQNYISNIKENFYGKITSFLKHNYLYRDFFITQYEKITSISDIISICYNNTKCDIVKNNDTRNIDISIQEKINDLRTLVGSPSLTNSSLYSHVTESEQNKIIYSQAIILTIKQISKYYNLNLKEDDFSNIYDPLSLLEKFEDKKIRFCKCILTKDFFKTSFKPILAFKKDSTPIVIYSRFGKAYYIDSTSKQKIYITNKNINDLEIYAYNIYFVFPKKALKMTSLIEFVFSRSFNILLIFAIMGIIGSLLGIIMPMFTSYTIDNLIPFGKFDILLEISIFLLVISISQTILNIIPSITIMIFSVNQLEKYMGALFDRLLKLPPNFIKKYSTGDLTSRLFGGLSIQNAIFSIITSQFISLLAIITGLVMMFYYDSLLASIGIAISLIFSFAFLLLSLLNFIPLKKQAELSGNLAGFTKQIFSAIIKIREAGAESRILNKFLQLFVKKEMLDYSISRNSSIVNIFTSIYPLIVSITFYTLIVHFHENKNYSIGTFMAFMAAFQYFSGGVNNLFQSIWSILAIQPNLNRIKPILEEKIENENSLLKINKLQGQVELSNISFKYPECDNYILNDVSIKCNVGEFIAIVGPSGSGKSSLIKILLGFESPNKGSVYYDGKDLKILDLQSLRANLGVVLQQTKLINASILDNILIGTNKTYDDAQNAITKASLDQDIANFSMKIHTLVTDDTLSGGQKQRVLIARSLVKNPKIVIFDEATSALDNITQQNVMNNLKKFNVSRIVVAHRISTIKDADRIYVLDKGKIVEQGKYNDLIAQNGLFMKMVKQQSI